MKNFQKEAGRRKHYPIARRKQKAARLSPAGKGGRTLSPKPYLCSSS